MRLRRIKGAEEAVTNSPYCIQNSQNLKGNWHTAFAASNPIHIEIGMGKGQFLMTIAEQNPNVNYIGIERYESVLIRAVQKMESASLTNPKFICMDALELSDVFAPGETDRLYLNFSDPWPKDRHAKRRLPSKEFLARYDVILKRKGRLEFKTDNKDLFDFALEQLPLAGWEAEKITFDLHHDEEMIQGNIMTEYEEKFSALGNPICKYIIYRKK